MAWKINKTWGLVTILALLNLACSPLMVFAQSKTQEVSQSVEPAIYFKVPKTLDLPNAFAGDTGALVYGQFNPDVADEQIKVTDFRYNGGFDVNLTVSNFTKDPLNRQCVIPGECISYRKIGIVTLAANGIDKGNTDSIDYPTTGKLNNPPGSDNVGSVLDCDWDSTVDNFKDACETKFEYFTGSGSENSNPKQIIYGGSVTPGVRRTGLYWLALGLKVIVPANTIYGSYTSTFTFDLIPEPYPNEICANGIDDDNDGYIDEAGCTP